MEFKFPGSTFSVEKQGNPLPQSNFSFGTAPLSDSSVKKPFSSTGTLFGLSASLGGNSFNGAPRNYAFGESSTIFGAPNNSGFGVKSTQTVMPSNSADGISASSIFGVPNGPPSGFQGFGVRSTPSFWSASASSRSSLSRPKDTSDVGAPAISNFSNSNTLRFHLSSTPESGNRSIFGIQSSSDKLAKLGHNIDGDIEFSWSKKMVRRWFGIKCKSEELQVDVAVNYGG